MRICDKTPHFRRAASHESVLSFGSCGVRLRPGGRAMSTRRTILAFSGLLVVLLLPGGVIAQCTDPLDTKALKKHLKLAARCNDRILKSGTSVVCAPIPPPPACAGTLPSDALTLAYGDNNPPASGVDPQA